MKKRLLSILCVLALCLTLLPATALAADGNKTIMLGTSGIKDPTPTATDKGKYYTPSSYIYFGVNGSDPIKWRVLNDDTANDNSTAGVFLLSEYLLASGVYFQQSYHNEGNDPSTQSHKGSVPSDGDHTNCLIANAWQGSDAQEWCKTFASNSSNFSAAEQSAMLGIVKTDSVENNIYHFDWGESSLTAEDKMFFLSAWELANYVGGYDYAPELKAQFVGGGVGDWWLRSPIAERSIIAGLVDYKGKAFYTNLKSANAVRPAFNLDQNSVLFTSAATGGKSASGMDSGLTAVDDYTGNEWKLTLLDESRNFAVTETEANCNVGATVTLDYTGATIGTNEYISVLLTDQQDSVLYYGRIVQATKASGQIQIKIPDSLEEGTYTLNVFSEQYNGGTNDNTKQTDYASAFAAVTLNVDKTAPALSSGTATRTSETAAAVKFTSSEVGKYYYAVVESGAATPTIDTTGAGTACASGANTISLNSLAGAGAKDIYIVAKDAAGNVSYTLKIKIPEFIPTYTISASPATLNFVSQTVDYTEAPAAQTVTIQNTGNQNVTVTLPSNTNYTITAGTAFVDGTATLAPNGTAEFTVQPKTGLAVGSYSETLTISSDHNTSAEVSLAFTVDPISLENAQVNVTGSYTYNGQAHTPSSAVTVTLNGTTLTEGEDYTLTYTNNVNAGTATVTATGAGNYTGAAEGSFTISKATPTYTVPTNLTATYGETLTNVTLPNGWSWDDDTTPVGNVGENTFAATFTPTDTANYNTVTENLTVSVSAKDITDAVITLGENLTYTGQEQTQQIASVTVDDLTVTTYEISGNTGTDADTYTLTISGTGNFTGEATQEWSIAKATYTGTTGVLGTVLANWPDKVTLPAIPAGASYGAPSTTDDLTGLSIEGGVLSYTGGESIAEGQEYEITVPVDGGKNYEDYTITVTLTGSDKQTLTITGVTAQGGTYNGQTQAGYTGTPSAEGYDGGFTVTYNTADGKAPTDAGIYTVTIAIPEDDAQYVGSTDLQFTIAQKPLTVSVPSPSVYVGDSVPELALTYTGLVDGERVTPSEDPVFTITKSDGTVIALEDAVKTAGTYTITWSNADSTTFPDGANYAIQTETTGTLTVSPRSTGGSGVTTYLVDVEDAADGEVKSSHSRASQGTTVTLIVIPDEGYELASLTITKSSGEDVKFTDKGNGKFTFTMPSGNVTVEAVFTEITPAPLPFTDVAENAWYAEAVRYVYEHGLMTGTSATTFAPNATTSRSMIATILWRMAGSPVVNYAMDYADVAQGQWYSEAIRWAASEGIVGGYGNGLFGTNDPITREQLVTMLYRYAQAKGYDTTQGGMAIREYADFEQISGYAVEAMTWAVNTGIINGTSSTTLSPQGAATRAQVATILMRFIEGMA